MEWIYIVTIAPATVWKWMEVGDNLRSWEVSWNTVVLCAKSLQLCLTLPPYGL